VSQSIEYDAGGDINVEDSNGEKIMAILPAQIVGLVKSAEKEKRSENANDKTTT
jgi:hypothetical protein